MQDLGLIFLFQIKSIPFHYNKLLFCELMQKSECSQTGLHKNNDKAVPSMDLQAPLLSTSKLYLSTSKMYSSTWLSYQLKNTQSWLSQPSVVSRFSFWNNHYKTLDVIYVQKMEKKTRHTSVHSASCTDIRLMFKV